MSTNTTTLSMSVIQQATITSAINIPSKIYNFIGDDLDTVYRSAHLARELGDTDPAVLEAR